MFARFVQFASVPATAALTWTILAVARTAGTIFRFWCVAAARWATAGAAMSADATTADTISGSSLRCMDIAPSPGVNGKADRLMYHICPNPATWVNRSTADRTSGGG